MVKKVFGSDHLYAPQFARVVLVTRSYAKMGVAQEGRRDFWLMANWDSIIQLVGVEPLRITPTLFLH